MIYTMLAVGISALAIEIFNGVMEIREELKK